MVEAVGSEAPATAKKFFFGTHRTVEPRETLKRMRPFLAEIGITRVANVTGLDVVGIPTVMVVRPNSRSLSVTQGKGIDLDAAKASGVMEAVEHFLAEHVDANLRLGSQRELERNVQTVDVRRLPQYSRRYEPDDRTLWTEGHELVSRAPLWVPYELVHLDFTLPLPAGSGFFLQGSNGLASGNHRLEAVMHALYEVVERDSVSLFYQLSAEEQWQRRIDLDTVDDASCRALLDLFDKADVLVGVWDATSDVGIATFLCLIHDAHPNPFRPMGSARGSGCHADRGIALSRALCEAAQSRLTRIAGVRDDMSIESLERSRTERAAALAMAQISAPSRPPRPFGDVHTHAFRNFDDEAAWASRQLSLAGLDKVVVVDLSRPEYPAFVMRVIVPGLEGVSEAPGYRPGERARRLSTNGPP